MSKKYRKMATFACLASIVASCLWLFFPIAMMDYGNGEALKPYFLNEDRETLLVFAGIMVLEIVGLLIPHIAAHIAGSVFSIAKGGFFLLLLKAVELLGTPMYTVLPGSNYPTYTLTLTAFAYLFLAFNGLSLLVHIVSTCFLIKEKRLEKEVSSV